MVVVETASLPKMSNKRAYLGREDEGPNSSEDVRSEVRETEVESTEDSSPRPQLGNDLADRPSTSQSLPAERQQQANEEFIRKWKEALEMTAGGRSHDAPKSHDTQTQNKRPEPTKHEVYCEGLYERALLRMKEKEARSAEHQREEEEKELKDLTFSPQISSYARNLESSPGPVEERLFKADEDSKNTIRALRRVQHDNEMEECTFKPTINVYKSTSNKETLPFFGRLKAESYQRQMKAAKQLEEQKEKVMETAKGKHRKYRRKSKASRGEVYNRLWAETSSNRLQKKEKPVWKRRESIMLNGAPLSPFALNLRTPQKRVAKVKGDKPLHNEWINNLYKDASVRRKVQRSREEAIDKQILDQTTCYSMTNHSFNIIMKTVSRQTMHILDKIFPDSDCILQQRFLDLVIEFEILPPLEKLGVRYLKYLPEEELLVDRLWKILATESGKEESRKGRQVVPKVAMHDFMILVECCILNGNIKQEMRELFNEKKNTEDAEFWRVLDAVSEMKLVNKQAYSNLKSSSSSESEDTGRSSKNAKDAKKSKKSFLQFYKTQLSHPEKVKVKTDKLRAKLDAEELSHCTFTPNVNRLHKNSKPARKVVRKRMSIVEHLPLNFQNAATGGSEMMPIEKREGAGQSGTPRMKAPKQKKPPSPNRVTYSVLKYPKGYNKHLDRMSVYTQFDPHCFHYVPDKEEECMMTQIAFYMEFRFQGKFASIPVHIRDNPRKIALVIAKHLGIPKEVRTFYNQSIIYIVSL